MDAFPPSEVFPSSRGCLPLLRMLDASYCPNLTPRHVSVLLCGQRRLDGGDSLEGPVPPAPPPTLPVSSDPRVNCGSFLTSLLLNGCTAVSDEMFREPPPISTPWMGDRQTPSAPSDGSLYPHFGPQLESLSLVKCSTLRCLAIGLTPIANLAGSAEGGGTEAAPWSAVPILSTKAIEALKRQKQWEMENPVKAGEVADGGISPTTNSPKAAANVSDNKKGVAAGGGRSDAGVVVPLGWEPRTAAAFASMPPFGIGGSSRVAAGKLDLSWRQSGTRAFSGLKLLRLNITNIQVCHTLEIIGATT